MAKLVAQEVMTDYNSRSSLGRVVVNPPNKMSALKLHDTLPMYLCCGRAFLSEESYVKHKTEIKTHGKPIDLTNIRTAINDRSSIAFWRSRKEKPAMSNGDDDMDDDDGINDQIKVEGSDWNEESKNLSREHRKQPGYSVRGKRRYKTCNLCQLEMPGTNIPRHIRTCHNPSNQFNCKHCTCRFVSAYGRMVHTFKTHKPNSSNPKPIVRSSSAKKMISLTINQKKRVWKPSASEASSPSYVQETLDIESETVGSAETCNGFAERPFKCPDCFNHFALKSSVTRHQKTCHVSGGSYPCPFNCGCVMGTEVSLRMHRHLCGKGKQLNRPKVRPKMIQGKRKMMIPQVGTIDIEMKLKTNVIGKNLYHCDLCNKNITCSGNFRDHLNSHSGTRPHKCPMCDLCFTFKSNIKRHIRSSHVENGEFVCPNACSCRFANEMGLKVHLVTCQKQIKLKRLLKNATSIKGKIVPKRQPTASNVASTSSLKGVRLNKYSTFAFASADRSKFQCEVCQKVVISKRNLRNHMFIHLNLKPFICTLCGIGFRATESLKKHQTRAHIPDGPFPCSRCPCRFNRDQGLMMHMKIYHIKADSNTVKKLPQMPKLKPMPTVTMTNNVIRKKPSLIQHVKTEMEYFECKVCGKQLQTLNSLRNHGLIHTGEKPIQCKICGYRFRLASTLYDHMRSSHSNGTFMCKHCPCRFESENGLYRHEGVYHGIRSVKYASRKANYVKRQALKLNLAKKYNSKATLHFNKPNNATRPAAARNLAKLESKPPSDIASQSYKHPSFKMEVDNDSSALFQCGHCQFGTNTLQTLTDHQRIHTQPQPGSTQALWPQKCPICSHKIHDSSNYRLHMKSNHSGGAYGCSECPSDFHSQKSLSCHISRFHSHSTGSEDTSSVIRVERRDSYDDIEVYDDNDETDETEIPSNFPEIPLNFPEISSNFPEIPTSFPEIQLPLLTKTPRSRGSPIPCEVCGKVIKGGQMNYTDHMNSHLKIRPYTCNICNLSFRIASILACHKKKSHGNGKHACAKCPCRFATSKGLSVHLYVYHKGGRTQLGNKSIDISNGHSSEDIDAEGLPQSLQLNRMPITPLKNSIVRAKGSPKDRPMQCKECQEVCLGPIRLQKHMESHQETEMQAPTECSGCGLFFETTASFVHHIKINAGDPFRCRFCCLTVTSVDALRQHFDDFHSQEELVDPDEDF